MNKTNTTKDTRRKAEERLIRKKDGMRESLTDAFKSRKKKLRETQVLSRH